MRVRARRPGAKGRDNTETHSSQLSLSSTRARRGSGVFSWERPCPWKANHDETGCDRVVERTEGESLWGTTWKVFVPGQHHSVVQSPRRPGRVRVPARIQTPTGR